MDRGRPGEVNIWQILYSVTSSTMFCWSFSLTAILGTVRCLVIHFPFIRINKTLVLSIAVGMVTLSAGGATAILFPRGRNEKYVWVPSCMVTFPESYTKEQKMTLPLVFVYIKTTGNMAVSLCSAVLSVWGLKKAEKLTKDSGNEKIRGGREAAMTIVFLNMLICLQFKLVLTSVIIQFGYPEKMILGRYFCFLASPVSNTLISAFNPLIYIVRCSKIRQEISKRVFPQYGKVSDLQENTSQSKASGNENKTVHQFSSWSRARKVKKENLS